jgi:hypothetical protein
MTTRVAAVIDAMFGSAKRSRTDSTGPSKIGLTGGSRGVASTVLSVIVFP